jgi:hypothetical protein
MTTLAYTPTALIPPGSVFTQLPKLYNSILNATINEEHVGWDNLAPGYVDVLRLDLGAASSIASVTVTYSDCGGGAGVRAPEYIKISTSDSTSGPWTDSTPHSCSASDTSVGAAQWGGYDRSAVIPVLANSRYIKVAIDSAASSWTMLTEIAVEAGVTVTLLFATLHQPYGDVTFLVPSLHQPYSILLETWLQQIYGDVPELSTALHQPYGDAAVLQRTILQPWADALQVEASLEQPFSFPETLQAAIEQRWGIVAAVLEKSCEQLFHLEQNTTLFAGLCQPYAMLGEAARLHSLSTKLYVGGVRIPYVALEWQATDSEFFWYCAFSVKSRAVADLCADGAAIRIEHMGEEYHLKCYGGWLLDRRHAEETYRVEGYSRTRGLDEATPLRQDFAGGLASQIVADLAAPFSIAVNWKMVDGWIADGKLTANDETPMTIIRNIVADMGGIVQTTPAGDLLIIAEEEIAIPDYPTAPVSATINASLERISTSEQRDEQKGYNKFVVSDQAAAGGQFALDYVEIDAGTRELRLFVVPLEGRQFTLTSSGGSEVTIEPVGIVDLALVDELVEFVAGSGRTQRPIHGISAQAWQRDNLGAITATEDGVLTAATTGYSLLKISYTSRYHKWLGRDSNIESVQFVATEVLP